MVITTLLFFILLSYIWIKAENNILIIRLPFLFQIVIIFIFYFYEKIDIVTFFILLFSLFDIFIYFFIKWQHRKQIYKINNSIKCMDSNENCEELIDKIIKQKEFGYINFGTKRNIIYIETLIILLSI